MRCINSRFTYLLT